MMFVVELEYRAIDNPIGNEIDNPSISQIESYLELIEKGEVEFLRLNNEFDEEKPFIEMDILGKPNFYLISVFFDSNRTFFFKNKSSKKGEMVELKGDMWPSSYICQDIEVIKEICKCFFYTGELSTVCEWYERPW